MLVVGLGVHGLLLFVRWVCRCFACVVPDYISVCCRDGMSDITRYLGGAAGAVTLGAVTATAAAWYYMSRPAVPDFPVDVKNQSKDVPVSFEPTANGREVRDLYSCEKTQNPQSVDSLILTENLHNFDPTQTWW